MRLPAWVVDRIRLPVPRWLVGMFDPAQVYMERSRRRPPDGRRHRPMRATTSYAPLTSDGRLPREWEKRPPPPTPPDVEERFRRRADERAVKKAELLASSGPVLDGAVEELQEQGTTVISIPPAVVSARIVRFRWGDSVLEIDGRRGTGAGVTSGSRTRLGRPGAGEQAETLKRYLVDKLADLIAGP